MSEDTLIEDLVNAGLSADLVGRVARVLVLLGKARNSAEVTEDRRRRDRERKSKKLVETNEIAKANDVAIVGGIPRKAAENGVACTNVSKKVEFNSKNKKVSTELNSTELTSTVHRARARGTRIPPDWQPSVTLVEWCRLRGVVGVQLESRVAEFIDYWVAIPGQRGAKTDWDATFRNRIRDKTPPVFVAAAAVNEPAWTKPPAEFLERQRNAAKGTSVRSDAGVGNNGAGHAPELRLSGGGILRPEVGGTQRDAPDDHIP